MEGGEGRFGEARRGEERRGEARRGEERRGEDCAWWVCPFAGKTAGTGGRFCPTVAGKAGGQRCGGSVMNLYEGGKGGGGMGGG